MRDEDLAAADRERCRERVDDPPGDPAAAVGADAVEQDGEFIAAQPGGCVVPTDAPCEPPADLREQLVARLMAEGVVDDLEAIDVDEQDREIVSMRERRASRELEPFEEQRTVRKARDRVVVRVVDP